MSASVNNSTNYTYLDPNDKPSVIRCTFFKEFFAFMAASGCIVAIIGGLMAVGSISKGVYVGYVGLGMVGVGAPLAFLFHYIVNKLKKIN